MPKELKNSAAILQRIMEKVLADQKGQNVEIRLEDIVMKRKSEQNLIEDVKETLRKLRRVNIKIDPTMSSFGVKEGKFLGHMVTELGQRADLERIHEIISSALLIEREGIQIPVSYVSRPLQGMEICYTPTEKRVQALIHTTRSLRTIFRKHKVKVEAEGLVMKKFFGQGEQVDGTPDANKGGIFTLSKKLQAKSTITPRAWRLYVGKEIIEKGLGAGIILVEGIHTPVTKQERKYKKEILDATAPFHRFRITHLPKILNSKAEVLTGLTTITLELLNQEVSVGIKTRPSVEETSSSKKGKSASNAPRAEPNYNREASGSN
ncbi:hypothetical protein Tco_0499516 [Tanacetum coccineum]